MKHDTSQIIRIEAIIPREMGRPVGPTPKSDWFMGAEFVTTSIVKRDAKAGTITLRQTFLGETKDHEITLEKFSEVFGML